MYTVCSHAYMYCVALFFVLSLDFLLCRPDASSPVIAFVSKLFAVDSSALPQNRSRYVCVIGDVIPLSIHNQSMELVM